jgi:glyoxylate reductase
MPKPKVFLTRRILDQGMQLVEGFCEVDTWPDELPPSRAEIIQRIKGCDGLLCLLTDRIDGVVMDAAGSKLKVISNHAVGVDNVDVEAATDRGLPVGNTPGILTDATADMAFALLLAAARRVVEGDRLVKKGGWKTWSPGFMLGADLRGSTLGIVGYGRIGRALAHRAAGFGMKIIYYEPHTVYAEPGLEAEPVDLDFLLEHADFISLHVPLTGETRGLMNAAAFLKMKPTAVMINTSRGPVVDQTALYDALSLKRIFAAALDVTEPEPLPPDNPLLTLENCIVLPHIASASRQTRQKMSQMAAENLISGLKGEPLPNCVNPEVYPSRD